MSICISDDPTIERNISNIFLCPECQASGYKLRMLESNRIPGLLRLKVTETDGDKRLNYDISSCESLSTAMNARVLSEDQIRYFVRGLNRVLNGLDTYLLDAEDIVMKPEYIYVSEYLEPEFCCVPDYCGDCAQALSDVLKEILGAVDQNDHKAVVLAYRLYQKTLEQNYVIGDLIDILESEYPQDERKILIPDESVSQPVSPYQEEELAARISERKAAKAAKSRTQSDMTERTNDKKTRNAAPDNDEMFEMMADVRRSPDKKKKGFPALRLKK